MRTSETIDQLAAALVAAQGAFPHLTKGKIARVPTKNGGEYSYRYADLADILTAVGPALSANGLAVTALPDRTEDGRPALTTRLLHASGQWVEATAELRVDPAATPQGYGSALTYGRRYALCAALGIAADEDDDGALAETEHRGRRRERGASQRTTGAASDDPVSEAQLRNIGRLFGALGVTDRDERLAYTSGAVNREVTSSKELTKREASTLIDRLQDDCDQREQLQGEAS